eukprot:9330690-Alexandrium_andersonii.AAC.1
MVAMRRRCGASAARTRAKRTMKSELSEGGSELRPGQRSAQPMPPAPRVRHQHRQWREPRRLASPMAGAV